MKAPPVTSKAWPVMKEAYGRQSSSIAPAASSAVPILFRGMVNSTAMSRKESPPGMPNFTLSPLTEMLCPESLSCRSSKNYLLSSFPLSSSAEQVRRQGHLHCYNELSRLASKSLTAVNRVAMKP